MESSVWDTSIFKVPSTVSYFRRCAAVFAPNVSVVDLVLKVSKKTSAEEVNAAIKAAADGACKGIINFETQPLVSSDFMQTDYSNSVDAALTMVMGEDLVKVVMWYDNEWGYSQRV